MSLITPEQAQTFDLRDLSDGYGGQLPSEVGSYPAFEKLAETFLDLQRRFDTERAAIGALIAEVPGAAQADRHALAVATAANEPDPGSLAVEALAERVTAARRRITGLADALDTAFRALMDAL